MPNKEFNIPPLKIRKEVPPSICETEEYHLDEPILKLNGLPVERLDHGRPSGLPVEKMENVLNKDLLKEDGNQNIKKFSIREPKFPTPDILKK